MFTMLVKSLPDLLITIKQSYDDENTEELLTAVHKFHGACCYTGVPKLKQLAEIIESGLKSEGIIESIEPELLELIDEIAHIINDAKNWNLD